MAADVIQTGASVSKRHGRRLVAIVSALIGAVAGAAAFLAFATGPAEALPSYARQTGQPCAA